MYITLLQCCAICAIDDTNWLQTNFCAACEQLIRDTAAVFVMLVLSDIDDVITSTFMASQTERCREQVRYSHTPVPGSHDGDSYLTLAVEVALIGMRKTACLDFTISLAASSVYQLHVMYVAVT